MSSYSSEAPEEALVICAGSASCVWFDGAEGVTIF